MVMYKVIIVHRTVAWVHHDDSYGLKMELTLANADVCPTHQAVRARYSRCEGDREGG